MSIDINEVSHPYNTTRRINELKTSAPNGNIQPTHSSLSTPNDTMNPSSTASQLQALESALASHSIINNEKVNTIKIDINHGAYAVDAQRVAEKMLSLEGMINAKFSV